MDILIDHPPQCLFCQHYEKALFCDAFPDGIPEAILTGEHDHTDQYPGDNGIRFEPIDKGKQ